MGWKTETVIVAKEGPVTMRLFARTLIFLAAAGTLDWPDATVVSVEDGFMYLTAIIDWYSGRSSAGN
ncbi:MAG: hypothetical protein ACLFPV_07090 [Spirochaetaceae bacterium]